MDCHHIFQFHHKNHALRFGCHWTGIRCSRFFPVEQGFFALVVRECEFSVTDTPSSSEGVGIAYTL